MQGAYDGQEDPKPQELYALLQEAFTKDAVAGKIGAVALAANVVIPDAYESQFADGIRVHLAAPGDSRYVYLPYRIEPRSLVQRLLVRPSGVTYGEAFAVDVPAAFF